MSLATATPREAGYYRQQVFAQYPLAHLSIEVHRRAPAAPGAFGSSSKPSPLT